MGLDPNRLFVTVHHTDDEAAGLWTDVAGVAPERIYRLGDKDNFWQMADTGPCGPCSEIHYDLRPREEWGTIPGKDEFERRGEAASFWSSGTWSSCSSTGMRRASRRRCRRRV